MMGFNEILLYVNFQILLMLCRNFNIIKIQTVNGNKEGIITLADIIIPCETACFETSGKIIIKTMKVITKIEVIVFLNFNI